MIEELYVIAKKHNVEIHYFEMKEIESLSIPGAIAIDKRKMKNSIDEKEHLYHEMGHCVTGSFYNIHCKFDLREKKEYKADKWAIKELLPFPELLRALEQGITEVWRLAEHFEVSENLIKKALRLYEEKLLHAKEKMHCEEF